MPYHELLAEPMARLVGASSVRERSRDDELAHRQPAPDDGELLPAHPRAASDSPRGSCVPLGRLRARVSGHPPRLRPGRGARAAAARRGKALDRHRGRRRGPRPRRGVDRPGPASGSPVLHGPGLRHRGHHAARPREGVRRRLRPGARGGKPGPAPPRLERGLRRVVHVQVPELGPGLGRRLLRPRAARPAARPAASGRLVGPRQGIALPDGARISTDPRRGGMAALEPSDPLARGDSRFARRLHGSGGNGAAAGEVAPPHGATSNGCSSGSSAIRSRSSPPQTRVGEDASSRFA